MAKSGRSKSKIQSRNIRREVIYGPKEAERLLRLATKQADCANAPSSMSGVVEDEVAEVSSDKVDEDVPMDEDNTTKSKKNKDDKYKGLRGCEIKRRRKEATKKLRLAKKAARRAGK
ncbi:hypothetical protein H4R33_002042 [Dimargaris cristalligena]|uniref:DUF2423 domain-containing protein n=1 Tax=Dimargaris cristalligena TaxID=215637 RepID=A0A4P9ZWB7_9FUNG|nr:hypothetical protein H4R33_002042 [Dimargaris cristalligena]RKP37251.1 hypothetical protein BJ085DRAFT_35666 [Dimargaris cristalligena]|eukprot:RKP37251.1 hypothetical protein BJ085DRAFT_35666 [Dimargaris cristalligena]